MTYFKTLALAAVFFYICSMTPSGDALECVSCEFTKITKIAGFDTGNSGSGEEDCWSSPDTQSTVNCSTSLSGYVARCYANNIRVVTTIIGIQSVTRTQERGCIVRANADDPGAVCLTDEEIADLAEDQSGLDVVSASGNSCACSDEDSCNSAISVQSATMLTAAIFAGVVAFAKHL